MATRFLLLAAFATAAVGSEGPLVPSEFLGTWASAPIDCKRTGETTLRITETTVQLNNTPGYLNAGASPGANAIEVIFRTPTGRAKAQNVRTYTLSTDGLRLLELRGGQVVATRTRCEVQGA